MGLIIGAAMITFIGALLMLGYLPAQNMRRAVGQYRVYIDVCMHVGIIAMFLGTSTAGLLQAEAAGIGVTLYLRWYARSKGLERKERRFDVARGKQRVRWVRYETSIGLGTVAETEALAEAERLKTELLQKLDNIDRLRAA